MRRPARAADEVAVAVAAEVAEHAEERRLTTPVPRLPIRPAPDAAGASKPRRQAKSRRPKSSSKAVADAEAGVAGAVRWSNRDRTR